MVEAMDHELREKFARLEAQVEALQGVPQKLDSIIQLQVTMASVQESTRGQTEKLSTLVGEVRAQSEQIGAVNEKITGLRNKIVGGALVMSILVIPTSAFLIRETRDQIITIDRRVTGLEFEVQRAKAPR
jgi:DNA repair exonuclease SbcCD ATPase subunit